MRHSTTGLHLGTPVYPPKIRDGQGILYADVLELIGGNDPALQPEPPALYAVTMRARKRPGQRSLLESWFYPMQLGQPLPTLPIWLDVDLSVELELESSYEETCRFLRIE